MCTEYLSFSLLDLREFGLFLVHKEAQEIHYVYQAGGHVLADFVVQKLDSAKGCLALFILDRKD